jgi:hypothetical protein
MSIHPSDRKLARFLGLFSLGLGVTQLLFPDRVNRLIGVRDNPRTNAIERAVGAQELSAAAGIFAMSPPTPFLVSRLAGDVVHLQMLARALRNRRNDRDRLRAAIGSVAAITIVDAIASARSVRSYPTDPYPRQHEGPSHRQNGSKEEPMHATVPGNPAITIAASPDEIRTRMKDFEIEEHGEVTLTPAPGGRGTEVHVDVTKSRNPLKKVVGDDPEQKVRDNLRRLKQVIEVGEVTRSDATPEGVNAKRQLKQRPAKPLDEKELATIGGNR